MSVVTPGNKRSRRNCANIASAPLARETPRLTKASVNIVSSLYIVLICVILNMESHLTKRRIHEDYVEVITQDIDQRYALCRIVRK